MIRLDDKDSRAIYLILENVEPKVKDQLSPDGTSCKDLFQELERVWNYLQPKDYGDAYTYDSDDFPERTW